MQVKKITAKTGIFVIMSVDTFRTDIVFIGDVIMCFRSD
jgi:hypothetical protein